MTVTDSPSDGGLPRLSLRDTLEEHDGDTLGEDDLCRLTIMMGESHPSRVGLGGQPRWPARPATPRATG
jgi:hypothetical protein